MLYIQIGLQIIIALGIINVWCFRRAKASAYRGGNALNIEEEFAAYGLPKWVFYTVGISKVSCAIALILGIWLSALVLPAAGLLTLLMLGAVAMHLKVKDPLIKFLPAAVLLSMCLIVVFLV